jgi:hypothetical protein
MTLLNAGYRQRFTLTDCEDPQCRQRYAAIALDHLLDIDDGVSLAG